MIKSTFAVLTMLLVMTSSTVLVSVAQRRTKPLACKPAVFAAFKPLPKLKYRCGDDPNDYDEKILKRADRIRAIRAVEQRLESFSSPAWWQASVDDLNLCELRGKAGPLSKDEQEKVRINDYAYDLFGINHSLRLAYLPDPCYQTGYGGANAFLLYRKAGRVFVTQVLDGFYSRADNPVGLGYADLNGRQVVEISTGTGGLHPSTTSYFFAVDAKTNRAAPKKLFKSDRGFTNEISSDLLMDEPENLDLPKDASELNIIRGHRLALEFSLYSEDEEGKLETPRGKMRRTILKWNGRFYE